MPSLDARTASLPAWDLDDHAAAATLARQGFVLLSPERVRALAGLDDAAAGALAASWDDLPPDEHLRDGGRYRFRRHASLVDGLEAPGALHIAPRRPHYQPLDYNALHGGYERWFAPCSSDVLAHPAFQRLVQGLGALLREARGEALPYVEVHQFRITTADGIGRPTPEGAHRDGVEAVAVLLLDRAGVRGGETRVFEADGPAGLRFTMREPWTCLLLDDHRMIHETTPLQPEAEGGHRDTLVLTWRRDGFLDPPR